MALRSGDSWREKRVFADASKCFRPYLRERLLLSRGGDRGGRVCFRNAKTRPERSGLDILSRTVRQQTRPPRPPPERRAVHEGDAVQSRAGMPLACFAPKWHIV
jgi:hypothetical protein